VERRDVGPGLVGRHRADVGAVHRDDDAAALWCVGVQRPPGDAHADDVGGRAGPVERPPRVGLRHLHVAAAEGQVVGPGLVQRGQAHRVPAQGRGQAGVEAVVGPYCG
jgi:hypothetical protein